MHTALLPVHTQCCLACLHLRIIVKEVRGKVLTHWSDHAGRRRQPQLRRKQSLLLRRVLLKRRLLLLLPLSQRQRKRRCACCRASIVTKLCRAALLHNGCIMFRPKHSKHTKLLSEVIA